MIRRRLLFLALVALVPCLVVCAGGAPAPSIEKPPPARAPELKQPKLEEIDKLVKDQKLEEAGKQLEVTIADARKRGDDDLLAFALVRRTQLRTALGGYETAVRELKDTEWPKAPVPSIALELYYAHALTVYVQQYGYEIGRREKVDTKGVVDLTLWTRDQIAAEALRAYTSAWKRRDAVASWPVGLLSPYLDSNTYPQNVRGTLRDAISYLAVAQLADSSLWRPEQANDVFRIDFAQVLNGGGTSVALDGDAHPINKLATILDDLEEFHVRAGHPEAALEARLERMRRLYASFTDAREREQLAAALTARLAKDRKLPWWAMGQALAAEWAQQKGELVRAHQLADDGRRAYPGTMGGKICEELALAIEAPDYVLSGMRNDAPDKRSLLVTARNLPRIYFRAYPVDLRNRLGTSRDYNLLLGGNELNALLSKRAPVEWSTELAPTPDFASHRTFVVPPLKKKGFYAIFASATPAFTETKNRRVALQMSVSDLVFTSRPSPGGKLDVTVHDGRTGKLQEGATVELWELDYRNGHHQIDEKTSDKAGAVHFSAATSRSVFLLAHHGDDLTIDPQAQYLSGRYVEPQRTRALVYTDRSVYRPGQKVLWKAIAYDGSSRDGRWKVVPGKSFTVSLRDANYQEVQKLDVKGSAFGSASGEFTIPASGRLLGGWQIMTNINGAQGIRVEEYKRPTFEVTLKEPPAPVRLNQPARLVGEARYYFGLPVTAGEARYTITREPVYPYWWGYYGWGQQQPTIGTQTLARGVSPLGADGTFEVKFVPEAKKELDARVSYRYTISADITDEGGETRSASRSYRVGKATVEARVSSDAGFFDAGKAGEVNVRRTDLDGNPRAGKGTWRIMKLTQTDKTLLPAELPASGVREDDEAGTAPAKATSPGDKLRARTETTYSPQQVLASWKDGAELAQGELITDDKGLSTWKLPALPAGAYRVRYETADDAGMKAEAALELVVAGESELHLPAYLAIEHSQVLVGGKLRLFTATGLDDQLLLLDTFRSGELVERRMLTNKSSLIELEMKEGDRGGLAFVLSAVRDHQLVTLQQAVTVPWDNQALKVSYATFRDKLRPGGTETFRVSVAGGDKSGARLQAGTAELLAYMYDRSLDLFAPHNPQSPMGLFPYRAQVGASRTTLSAASQSYLGSDDLRQVPHATRPESDRYRQEDAWGLGGMGLRGQGYGGGGRAGLYRNSLAAGAPAAAPAPDEGDVLGNAGTETATPARAKQSAKAEIAPNDPAPEVATGMKANTRSDNSRAQADAAPLRSNFSETAFWKPTLLLDGKGETSVEFTVPDSVTSWRVWVHALTKDMRSGSASKETRSVKDLMVRPYLPRFLREGDEAVLKVVVNNAGTDKLDGTLSFDIVDPETKESRMSLFGGKAESRVITIEGGKSTSLSFPVKAPRGVATYAVIVKATASAKGGKETFSDGELRPVPLLPSRLHLTQSRFVTLRDADKREMKFDDLAKNDDPSRANEKMVVTIDAQLFYTVLRALPYLIEYPYECAEQTLNRFVSTGIVTSLFNQYPAIRAMADQMSRRTTQLQAWDAGDANRKMALEEAPFLYEAKGGAKKEDGLINVLDARIARANRDGALDKLRKMQTSVGGFPWFPGGPPSPYMTLYVLYGFAKAAEFKVEVPKDLVQRGWQYVAQHYRSEYAGRLASEKAGPEFLTLLNYVASSYPDDSWTGGALTMDERKKILDYSFKHWRDHSPYLKGMLALTLKRMGRAPDGKKVFDSVMDSAKTAQDQGTFWQPEDRSWLWYKDTIESHAFALRVLMELDPQNQKKDGLVLWLLLNKKLNQWKSTRATAEVIYSLAKYMQADQSLGVREAATVSIGARQQTYTFEPDKYVGKVQMIIPGAEVDAKAARVTVEKKTKGVMFASATWSFATDKLPTEARGDFFTVKRTYFLRENNGKEYVLKPIADGQALKPGDELEVQLAISAKHEAEYVHLRDPRGAGFEPVSVASRYKWDLGLGYYEEVRDSGANFFFERLPAGQYTFKYRVRATTAGAFRVGPAELQSMYAPEFSAYSTGQVLKVAGQ